MATTATIRQVVDAVAAKAGALAGMRKAPTDPPEMLSFFPFAVTFAGEGEWDLTAIDWKAAVHTVICEIYVGRKDLPKDMGKLMPYVDTFPDTIFSDMGISDTVDNVRGLRYRIVEKDWGGIMCIGYRFELDVEQYQARG